MALAFKNGVIAGRQSFLSGRIKKIFHGEASSSNDLMVMRTGSRTMFSISNDGVLQLGEYQGSTPTAVEGGLFYCRCF